MKSRNRLLFLGTAGGSEEAALFLQTDGKEGFADSQALLNSSTLIDCSATGLAALTRDNVDCSKLRRLFITHSHRDHLDPDAVAALASRAGHVIDVYGDPRALSGLHGNVTAHPLTPGMQVPTEEGSVLALPANHGLPDPAETPLHYLFRCGERTLWYALDGCWMMTRERKLLQDVRVDLAVLDATSADPDDWRSFEHNTLAMLIPMCRLLRQSGIFSAETKILLSHRARKLWTPAGERAAEEAGFLCARDHSKITF